MNIKVVQALNSYNEMRCAVKARILAVPGPAIEFLYLNEIMYSHLNLYEASDIVRLNPINAQS